MGGNRAPAVNNEPVPSLAVAINGFTPLFWPYEVDSVNCQSVQEILKFVYLTLAGGLHWAWHNLDGRGNIQDPDSLDEQWARLITEMLLFVPYQGPNSYGYPVGSAEKVIFKKMFDASDPAYPIMGVCQNLATMAGITRGFSALAEHNITQLSAANVALEKVGGKVIPSQEAGLGLESDSAGQPMSKVARALSNKAGPDPGTPLELTPGSCYVRPGNHVAFILRVDKEKRLVQFFDTGGMTKKVPQEPYPKALYDIGAYIGIYDYHWQADVNHQLTHWGFLPRDDEKLKGAIDIMRAARPLGFARLILRDLKSKKIVFATPLLLMYGPDPKMNFSISRFMWALRHMPGREQLEALVMFFIPRRFAVEPGSRADKPDNLVLQLLNPPVPAANGDNTTPPREISLLQMVEKVRELKGKPQWSPSCPADYKCVTIIHTISDLEHVPTSWKDSNGKTYQTFRWKAISGSFQEGLVGVRHREVVTTKSEYQGATVWVPPADSSDPKPPSVPPADLAELAALPWNQPSFGKEFGTEEDWQKLDWTGFEYFKGSWDGTTWNAV